MESIEGTLMGHKQGAWVLKMEVHHKVNTLGRKAKHVCMLRVKGTQNPQQKQIVIEQHIIPLLYIY